MLRKLTLRLCGHMRLALILRMLTKISRKTMVYGLQIVVHVNRLNKQRYASSLLGPNISVGDRETRKRLSNIREIRIFKNL